MTPPTPEELLRLARKAFPGLEVFYVRDGGVYTEHGWLLELPGDKHRALPGPEVGRQALHAALLRLAGEADLSAMLEENAALLAERDRLRDGIKLLIAGAEEERYGGGPVVGVGQLEQLLEDP